MKFGCYLKVANKINPSSVHVVLQPISYTLIPSILANSPNKSDENSEEELLNIAGKSIFDHGKIHGKRTSYYYNHHTKISQGISKHK
jgi:hypothetical protein